MFESIGVRADEPFGKRIADAWFQSVTFRTAGFNTVDHGSLEPSTKLFSIGLMFIGASPGSTGGGVKIVAVAIIVLALISILRGRRHVECYGRMIPDDQVRYAIVIISMGLGATMISTLLLTVFEADTFPFLDILYESTSAFATVGVSTGITSDLTPPSQLVIVVTMFLGRVGPLTLLMALAGKAQTAQYQFPQERVSLG
jgi:trk system potassium uptake protein TrkH